MRKRRLTKVSFNSKLIMDVIAASLIVQKAPLLIDKIFPLDGMVRAVAGVGVGYLAGSMFKRPDLANASIALGVIDFVSPFVDDLLGGGSGAPLIPTNSGAAIIPGANAPGAAGLQKYFHLNDYISDPSTRQNYFDYNTSYNY